MAAQYPAGWDAVGVRVGVVLLAVGWVAGWWLLARVPRMALPASTPGLPRHADVTIVIPARNEAESLPHLLQSLADQDVVVAQIVVVNDGSHDATGEVARSMGATVIDAEPLPEGWTGKSWACKQGAAIATGSTLVFLDADVRILPGGLAAVLDVHAHRGGLVSVQPYHRMYRPYERLSAVFNATAVMGVGMASPGRDGRADGAFGPCLVCSADDYRAVGGHDAVRADILEDIALGRVFARNGFDVSGLGGRSAIEFRMYPAGLRQLVEGWSKNMASGSATISRVRMLATVAWVSAAVGSAVEVVQWMAGAGAATTGDVWVGYVLFAVQFAVMLRQLGNFGWWPVVVYPVALLAFVTVFFNSLWLTVVRRQVRWRGRAVALPARRAPDV